MCELHYLSKTHIGVLLRGFVELIALQMMEV
jgi:hypothetical protein